MQEILTSKGKTYNVDYCGVGYLAMLKMQIKDRRPIGEVAPEFEGLTTIQYTEDAFNEDVTTFEGYSKIYRIEYVDPESIVLILMREPGTDDG